MENFNLVMWSFSWYGQILKAFTNDQNRVEFLEFRIVTSARRSQFSQLLLEMGPKPLKRDIIISPRSLSISSLLTQSPEITWGISIINFLTVNWGQALVRCNKIKINIHKSKFHFHSRSQKLKWNDLCRSYFEFWNSTPSWRQWNVCVQRHQ